MGRYHQIFFFRGVEPAVCARRLRAKLNRSEIDSH